VCWITKLLILPYYLETYKRCLFRTKVWRNDSTKARVKASALKINWSFKDQCRSCHDQFEHRSLKRAFWEFGSKWQARTKIRSPWHRLSSQSREHIMHAPCAEAVDMGRRAHQKPRSYGWIEKPLSRSYWCKLWPIIFPQVIENATLRSNIKSHRIVHHGMMSISWNVKVCSIELIHLGFGWVSM
jgi:hypothetical protein